MEAETRQSFERFADALRGFEEVVFAQRPFDASHYDADYFASAWRAEGNRYDVDTRRQIEGRHPELVRDVLEPRRALDVGCGPGFLMLFLLELGVDVHGVDFSPAAVDLAPPAVKERIALAAVDALGVPDRSHDVVICREVFEHLTVLQVRRTVAELCRASSRLVYATTRFHPAPETLLDVTTDADTDPTHITLLAKDFLRTLFVLEGFRSRTDLEQRLDWAGKGRVLVYERCA
jgi:2-polyprenyl-3-methyl-5-hydroxy-6-metoxy-1,4-benzoquinol methylase